MATLLEDLSDIDYIANGLTNNKVANFAYTQEAYENNNVAGVSEYNVNNAQNIPTAEAETLDVNPTVLNKGYRSQASSITRMLMNHFLGRTSYNLNKSIDIFKLGFSSLKKAIGKPEGIATLDENGYLSKEQTNPAMLMSSNKGKLKEFLFSGKEPTFKSLNIGVYSSPDLILARSINEKEDIILRIEATSVRAYIYDGKTVRQLGSSFSAPFTPRFLCEYKNYALFVTIQDVNTNFVVFLSKFNFNTKTFETKTVEYDKYQTSTSTTVTVNFNKSTECFDIIENKIPLQTSEGGYTERTLISVDVETFTERAKTLYIPNQVNSLTSIIGNYTVLSDDLLILYQEISPAYKLFVYRISDLENEYNGAPTMNSLSVTPVFAVREGTKTYLCSADTKVLAVDNGNMYSFTIPVGNELYESAVDVENGYLLVKEKRGDTSVNNYTTIEQIYKNDKLCTTLSYAGNYTFIYDSVFYADGALRDVENNENVIKSNYFKDKIVSSDKRVYITRYSSNDGYDILEITNVLD